MATQPRSTFGDAASTFGDAPVQSSQVSTFGDAPHHEATQMPAQWGRNQQIIAQREAQAQAPGFWQGVGNVLGPLIKQAPTQIMNMLTGHPIQDILNRNEDIRQQSREALARGDYSTAAGLNLAGIMPGTGDLAIQSGEAFGSGDIGGGIANAGMAMAPFVRGAGGAELANKAAPITRSIGGAVKAGVKATPAALKNAAPLGIVGAAPGFMLGGPRGAAIGSSIAEGIGATPDILKAMGQGWREANAPPIVPPLTVGSTISAFDNSQLTPVAQGMGPVRPPLSPSQSSATSQVGVTQANVPPIQSGVGTPVRPPLSPFEPTSNIPVRPAGAIPPVPPSSMGTRSPISPPLSTSSGLSIPVPSAESPVPVAPANVPPIARAQGFPVQAPIRSTSGTVVQAPQSTSGIPAMPVKASPMPGVGVPLKPPMSGGFGATTKWGDPVTVLGYSDDFEPYKTDLANRGGVHTSQTASPTYKVKHADGTTSLVEGHNLVDSSGQPMAQPLPPQTGRIGPLERAHQGVINSVQEGTSSGGSGPSSRFHAAEGSASSIVDVHQTTKYGTNIAQHLKAGGMTPEQFEGLRGNQKVLNDIAKQAHPKSAKQQNPFNMAQFDNTLQSLRDLYKK